MRIFTGKSIFTSFFIISLFASSESSAQIITPFTLNVGGGVASNGYYSFEWSIGEGASINSFGNSSSLLVTSGILQPFTGKASNTDFMSVAWTEDEIAVFPVPTHAILEMDINLAVIGKLSVQIYNTAGAKVFTKAIDYYQTNSIHKLDLSALSAGIYFMNVSLYTSPNKVLVRKGAFKIQKL